jgi:hypothetical protein
MWLLIFMVVLFALALGAGSWGHSRFGYAGWSPAGIVLLVAVVLFFTGHLSVGCAPSEASAAVEPPAADVKPAIAPTPSVPAAVQTAQESAYARKSEFVANMKRELEAIRIETERLAAQADKFDAAKKADAKVKLDAMREQWIRASEQLDLAQSADEPTWDAVRGGFEESFRDLKDNFTKTRQWLSDKIEP